MDSSTSLALSDNVSFFLSAAPLDDGLIIMVE
jgi:hypothetical protein